MASYVRSSGTSIYDVSTPLDPPGKSWQKVTDPAYNSDGQYSPCVLFSSISTFPKILINSVIILFAFLIGINEGLCLGSVIDAGVSTIFVGLGEDPMYVFHFSWFFCAVFACLSHLPSPFLNTLPPAPPMAFAYRHTFLAPLESHW